MLRPPVLRLGLRSQPRQGTRLQLARLLRRQWSWNVVACLAAALGATVLTAAAYRFSPALAAVLLLAVAGGAAVLAYPMLGVYAGALCAPIEYLDLDLGVAGLSAGEGVLLVAAGSVLLRMLAGSSPARPTLAHVGFAALIAISAVGFAFAPDEVVVLKIVLMWTAFLVLSLHVTSASPDELRWLLVAIAASGAILALLAVFSGQTVELSEGGALAKNRAQASFAHPAVLAFFLVLALPCAICLSLEDRTWLRVPMLLAAGPILAALMLTLTRGAIIGAAFSIVVLLWLPRFRLLAAVLLAGLVIFSAANLNPLLSGAEASVVVTRLGTITGSEVRTNPRVRIYRGAPQMVIDNPFFGIGAGNFPKVSPLYGLRDIGGDIFEHAHNLLLTIAVETGLVGLVALLVFLAGLLREARVILRFRQAPGFTLAMAPVAAIAGLLGSSVIDYPPRTNLVMAVFMMHVGALIAYARAADGSRVAPETPMNSL